MPVLTLFSVEGSDELIANIKAIEQALLAAAPQAVEDAAQAPMQLMRRLAPRKSGALQRSIRFEISRGGEARSTLRKSGALRKTSVSGLILAGDSSTVVGGSRGSRQKHRVGHQWQNARLQEFGTTAMPANPFFFPAWRASRKAAKAAIAKALRQAFKVAQGGPARKAA